MGLFSLTFNSNFLGIAYSQDNVNVALNSERMIGDYQPYKTILNANDEEYKTALKSVFLLEKWKPFFQNLNMSANSKPFLQNNMSPKNIEILKTFSYSNDIYIIYNIRNKWTGEKRNAFAIIDKEKTRKAIKTKINSFLNWKLENVPQSEYVNVKYIPDELVVKLKEHPTNVSASMLRIFHYILPPLYAFDNLSSAEKNKLFQKNDIYGRYNFVFLSGNNLLNSQVLNELKKRTYRIDNDYYDENNKDIIATTNHHFKDLVDVEIPTGDYSKSYLINLGEFKGIPFITKDRFFYLVLTKDGVIRKGEKYTVLPYIFNDKDKESNIIQMANNYGVKRSSNPVEYQNRFSHNFWIERLNVNYLKLNNNGAKNVLGKSIFPETADKLKEASLEARKGFEILRKQKKPHNNYTLLMVENVARGDLLKQDFYVLQNAKEYNLSAPSDNYFLWKVEDLNKLIKEQDISIDSFRTLPKVITKTEANKILSKEMPAEYFTFLYNSSVYALIEDGVDNLGVFSIIPENVFDTKNIQVTVDSKLEKFDRKSQKYTEYVYELNGNFFEFLSDDKFNNEISLKDFFNSKHVKNYKKRIF